MVKKSLIGGSPASLYVMAATSPQAAQDVQYMQPSEICLQTQDIVNNYGVVYKTTGGGKISTDSVTDHIKLLLRRIVDNRVFDLYLKYMGVKMLTPSLLVPFALIIGKEQFAEVIKYYKKHDKDVSQTGGKCDIPIIDHKLIGNYLKLTGITKLSFSPTTLVPLGLLMVIYDIILNKKDVRVNTDGNVEIPKKYFKEFINPPKQSGGYILPHYSSIPPNYLQRGEMEWNGIKTHLTEFGRGTVFENNELQLNSNNNAIVDVSNITVGNGAGDGQNMFNPNYQTSGVQVPGLNSIQPGLPHFPSNYGEINSSSPQIWSPMGQANGLHTNLPVPKTMASGGGMKKKKKYKKTHFK